MWTIVPTGRTSKEGGLSLDGGADRIPQSERQRSPKKYAEIEVSENPCCPADEVAS